jgi:hypothetical protein
MEDRCTLQFPLTGCAQHQQPVLPSHANAALASATISEGASWAVTIFLSNGRVATTWISLVVI